jgi:hypothetical protein
MDTFTLNTETLNTLVAYMAAAATYTTVGIIGIVLL